MKSIIAKVPKLAHKKQIAPSLLSNIDKHLHTIDVQLTSVKIKIEKEGFIMAKDKRPKIQIDRDKETRTKDISKMIGEGGVGSRTYYDIEKVKSEDKSDDTEEDNHDSKDEK